MTLSVVRPVARGGGGGSGGSYDPPQLPIPKILFHLSAILFHPLAILFHLSAILFHPLAILFHPSAILFHPSAILFHPWRFSNWWRHADNVQGGVLVNVQEWGRFSNWWRHADNVQRGGCLWMSKSGGVFEIDDVTRTMSKGGGGAPGVPPIQVQTPPHLAGWLRAW